MDRTPSSCTGCPRPEQDSCSDSLERMVLANRQHSRFSRGNSSPTSASLMRRRTGRYDDGLTHASIYAHRQIETYVRSSACVRACVRVCVSARARSNARATVWCGSHTLIHIYIYIYIQMHDSYTRQYTSESGWVTESRNARVHSHTFMYTHTYRTF